MEQDFNIGDIVYLSQNYCDRFKPYEINEVKYFGKFIAEYIILGGHSISTNVIDYIKTKRINNINKILEDGNV